MKHEYYIAVLGRKNTVDYITQSGEDDSWSAEKNKPALKMSKKKAEEMLYNLVINGIPAVMVTAPEGCYTLGNEDT